MTRYVVIVGLLIGASLRGLSAPEPGAARPVPQPAEVAAQPLTWTGCLADEASPEDAWRCL
jgi:hypothetical protein